MQAAGRGLGSEAVVAAVHPWSVIRSSRPGRIARD